MKLLRHKRFVLSLLLMVTLMQFGGDRGGTQSVVVRGDYAPGSGESRFGATGVQQGLRADSVLRLPAAQPELYAGP